MRKLQQKMREEKLNKKRRQNPQKDEDELAKISDDDDYEYYRKEVGEEPDSISFILIFTLGILSSKKNEGKHEKFNPLTHKKTQKRPRSDSTSNTPNKKNKKQ